MARRRAQAVPLQRRAELRGRERAEARVLDGLVADLSEAAELLLERELAERVELDADLLARDRAAAPGAPVPVGERCRRPQVDSFEAGAPTASGA